MGLFDYMFDDDRAQRDDINAARREVANARFYSDLALENVEALRARILEQREDIRDLTVMVSVLVKMLAEQGTIDETVLRYRVEAELEAVAEASKPGEQLVTCIKCNQSMKAVYTSMTEHGAMCDRCMATG